VTQHHENGMLTSRTMLSPTNRRILADSQAQLSQLTAELSERPAAEVQQIQSFQDTFFNKLRHAIDTGFADDTDRTRSNLAHRFGGALQSTFGNDLLSRLDQNRLNAVKDAQADSLMAGHDLAADKDTSRLRRIQLLQNQIAGISQSAMDAAERGQVFQNVLSRQNTLKPQRRGSMLRLLSGLISPFSLQK
jgi:hypothetical protein